MTKTATEYLEEIIARNPDFYIEKRRNVSKDMFVTIGRALLVLADTQIYLTAHKFSLNPSFHWHQSTKDNDTSYRLWIGKPTISGYSHPKWFQNEEIGIAEMIMPRDDLEIATKIMGKNYDQYPREKSFIIKETRIYKLK